MSSHLGGNKNDVVSLMYMAGLAGNIKRFQLRRVWITRIAVAAVLTVAATTTFMVDYVRVRGELRELAPLRTETSEQRDQLLEYADRMEAISGRLKRIGQLDNKLRIITNLDPADPLPLRGIGGIDGELLEPHQLTGLSRASRHGRMIETLDRLNEAAEMEEDSLSALISHLEDQSSRLIATPSIVASR